MVEKPSKLLATAKELISSQKLNDAVIICENVIKNDPNNINALLLATKCWMDLDIKLDNVKEALEKVLILKPMNPNAIQGLRKFYEKNFEIYFQDGVRFYKKLFQSNELNDKDYELITSLLVKNINEKETENFINEYLTHRINNERHVNSLMILFQIAAEKVIIDSNDREKFDEFSRLLSGFDSKSLSCDNDEIDYLQAMETLFKAFFDDMQPDYFYTLLDKNDSSFYGYLLFAKIVCEHYLFDDCQETIRIGLSKLESKPFLLRPEPVRRAFQITDITNSIHSLNTDRLLEIWPKDADQFVPKPIWCQSFAIGFDAFSHNGLSWSDVSEDWCGDMSKPQEIFCRYLMEGVAPGRSVDEDHQIIVNAELSSFELYLWSRVMKNSGLMEKHLESVEKGSQRKHLHYQIPAELAYVSIGKSHYGTAVTQFLNSLNTHFCPTILEHFVDMHMSLHQYAEPVEIFDKLEIE